MQTVRERSKQFIEDHIDELKEIARRIVTILKEPAENYDPIRDDWQGVTLRNGKAILISDLPEDAEIAAEDCLADLNVWYDEEKGATYVDAYPMTEQNGVITTDTSEWIRLAGGDDEDL